MRKRIEHQRYLPCSEESTGKVVREYEERYRAISDLLDANPEILALVDRDLKRLSRPSRRGRKATFTSEILFRAMVVHHVEGRSLRDTEILLTHSVFLQDFIRLGNRPAPSYSLLDRCLKVVRPATWEKVNEGLTAHAVEAKRLDPSELRVDTTVVETTIRYPTDNALLWDSFRVLLRLFNEAREYMPGLIENRFHARKVKKLYLTITRYASSRDKKRQRKVKKSKVKLIEQVERIAALSTQFARAVREVPDIVLQGTWRSGLGSGVRWCRPPRRSSVCSSRTRS